MKLIKHRIRSAYGYTDAQIVEHILEYGQEWALDSYEMIMEDQDLFWQLSIGIAPISRTPMDKKFGKELTKYTKSLRKNVSRMLIPWVEQRRIEAIRQRLSRPPESKVYDEHGKEFDIEDPDWWKKEV